MTIAQLEPLPLEHLRRGKVREVYIVDAERLLLVATDRVSAFDVVMNEPIPYKGAVLTQVTAWWLRQLEGDVRHHMISSDVDEIVELVPALHAHRETLAPDSDELEAIAASDEASFEDDEEGPIDQSQWIDTEGQDRQR